MQLSTSGPPQNNLGRFLRHLRLSDSNGCQHGYQHIQQNIKRQHDDETHHVIKPRHFPPVVPTFKGKLVDNCLNNGNHDEGRPYPIYMVGQGIHAGIRDQGRSNVHIGNRRKQRSTNKHQAISGGFHKESQKCGEHCAKHDHEHFQIQAPRGAGYPNGVVKL